MSEAQTAIELPRSATVGTWIGPDVWRKNTLALIDEYVKAGLMPKDMSKEKAFVVLQRGYELGLQPAEALTSLYVVNGKVALETHTMIALVHRAGVGHFEVLESTGEAAVVKCVHNNGSTFVSRFDEQMAKKAGLWGKSGPWSQYPHTMLLWRAISAGFRVVFPELFGGVYSVQEAETIDVPFTVTEQPAADPAPVAAPPLYMDPDELLKAAEDRGCSAQDLVKALARFNWTLNTVPAKSSGMALEIVAALKPRETVAVQAAPEDADPFAEDAPVRSLDDVVIPAPDGQLIR